MSKSSSSSTTTRMSSRSGVFLGALLGVVVAILMSATASSAAGAGAARVTSHEQGTRFSLSQSQPYHGKDVSGICGDLALWILPQRCVRQADRCLARSLEPFTPTHADAAAPPPSMPEPQSTFIAIVASPNMCTQERLRDSSNRIEWNRQGRALEEFFVATNGRYWTKNDGWLGPVPCNWFGVSCTSKFGLYRLELINNNLTGTV